MAKVLLDIIGKDKFSKIATKIESKTKRLKNAVRAIGTAGAAGILALGFAAKKTIDAFAIQEQAVARLEAAMKNVKTAGSGAAKGLIAYAAELQKVTKFGDEQIISAQAMLGTFQLNEEQIRAITPRLLDMAASQEKATGTAADLESISMALGKAFTGQIGLLSRYGVVLDKEMIKTEGFGGIIKSLDDNFKGMAKSVAATPTGKLKQMSNLFGDMKEEIGALVLIAIFPLVEGLKKLFEGFNALSATMKKMILSLGGALIAMKLFAGAITILLPAMGPAGWLLIGLGLAVGLFLAFSQNVDKAKIEIEQFNTAIANINLEDALTKMKELNETVKETSESTIAGISNWDKLKIVVKGIGKSYTNWRGILNITDALLAAQSETVGILESKVVSLNTKINELIAGGKINAALESAAEGFKAIEKIDLLRPLDLQFQKTVDLQQMAFEELSTLRQLSMEEELQFLEISWINIDKHQRQILGGEQFLQQQMFNIRRKHGDAWTMAQISAFNTVKNAFETLVAGKMNKILSNFVGKQKGLWGDFINTVIQGLSRAIAKLITMLALKKAASFGFFGGFGSFFETGGRPIKTAETGLRTTGRDTVPVFAQPGEVIVPRQSVQKNADQIDNLLSGKKLSGGGAGSSLTFNINAIDAQGVADFIASDGFKENLLDRINFNDIKLVDSQGGQLEGAY